MSIEREWENIYEAAGTASRGQAEASSAYVAFRIGGRGAGADPNAGAGRRRQADGQPTGARHHVDRIGAVVAGLSVYAETKRALDIAAHGMPDSLQRRAVRQLLTSTARQDNAAAELTFSTVFVAGSYDAEIPWWPDAQSLSQESFGRYGGRVQHSRRLDRARAGARIRAASATGSTSCSWTTPASCARSSLGTPDYLPSL